MTPDIQKPLRIFCSYSRKDEAYLNELRTWLRGLERQGLIEWWHDREIVPGWEWEEAIDKNLRTAEIILLLVTPDFMGSDYVFEKEIGRAVERHERGEARVIPIIVRPAHWKWAPFGRLQALPRDAKPITTWPNRDEAWYDVVEGIQRAVEELRVERQARAAKEQYRKTVEKVWADNKVSDADAEELGALASELGLSSDTAADIEHGVTGNTFQAILQRKRYLEDLHARARESYQNRQWQTVVDVFAQIHSEDPAYQDPEGLLASAREALETIRKEEEALHQYRRGVESAWMDAELDSREVETLRDQSNKLELSSGKTAEIERKVMGDTIEAILERQEQASREKERRARPDTLHTVEETKTSEGDNRTKARRIIREETVEEKPDAAEAETGKDEVVIPVTEEEVAVEKRPVAKDEVRMRKDVRGAANHFESSKPKMTSEERLRELEEKYEGYSVYDNRGEKIGKVDDLFIDEADREEYIGVKMGFFGRKSTLIPMDIVRVNEADRAIEVSESKDRVNDAPKFSDDTDITPKYENQVRDYFGLERKLPTRNRYGGLQP